MQQFEYKVVPAPVKGTKAKGVKGPEGRFANSVEALLNDLAAQGWEYQRAELLPSEERAGLTGSTTNWRNVLVFRRALDQGAPIIAGETAAAAEGNTADARAADPAPATSAAPPVAPVIATPPDASAPTTAPAVKMPMADGEDDEDGVIPHPVPGPGAVSMLKDDGVEEVSPVAGMTAALKTRAAQKNSDD